MNPITKTMELSNGIAITLETGRIARQADGAILLSAGNARMLATVVSNHEPKPGQSFFPLSVDYQEKFAGAGAIPGNFFRREARPSEHEILVCRLVDRAIRPLFPDGYMNETQVIISMISYDENIMTDALAAYAASAALTISDIPFAGPISEVRVARIGGELMVNPSKAQLAEADLEIMVGATMKDVTMVEGEMKEVSEEELIEAIKFGHEEIKKQCQAQLEFAEEVGLKDKRPAPVFYSNEEVKQQVSDFAKERVYQVAKGAYGKHIRKAMLSEIKADLIAHLGEEIEAEDLSYAKECLYKLEKHVIREMMLSESVRLDGRKLDEIRPLAMEADFLPSAHGSALFTRGETQSICTATLGSANDSKLEDNVGETTFNKFMLHYNFPPFCTGEAKPQRGTSRREVGHGNLANRSLRQVIPADAMDLSTIRIVSDITESNGSSSMATVCGGSIALMDAGVEITRHVSGIAMGLVTDNERFSVLSDILGDEDHLGDMDFKVTGTENGICACQMDIKIDGLPYEIMAKALHQARTGRLHILEAMNKAISEPRTERKAHVPKFFKIEIEKEFIGEIIGPGGKNIKALQAATETTVSIEEKDDKGLVVISGFNNELFEQAIAQIKGVTTVPEVGDEFEAKVKSIMPYGAFVEFLPGKQGLLHISEISWARIETMDGVMNEGDMVKVKIIGIDKKSGKFKLSRKVLMPKPEKK